MSTRLLLVAVLLIGVVARFATVTRPYDERSLAAWREADYLSIARSFDREGLDPLHPRVDWREDTPGYAEMELPVLPWLAALLYRLFGPHEQILRLLSALSAALALVLFARLAARVVPPPGALLATAAFAANPLLLHFAGSIQPDPLMVLLTILAMDALWRWVEGAPDGALVGAGAWAGAAILAKGFGFFLGFAFAFLILRKRGIRALADPAVWLAGALAVVPAFAWYAWAHHLYVTTGLSLGVTNEHHWISWALLRAPREPLLGNLRSEGLNVFVALGIPLAACAFLQPWRRIEPAVVWYLAAAVAYVLTANTSGTDWALYYHSISVPPACLLAGFGLAGLFARAREEPAIRAGAMRGVGIALGVALVAYGGFRTTRLAYWRDALQTEEKELYRCSRELAPRVPPDGKIVVRGGPSHKAYGHETAWNESLAFAWMDRKGFNSPRDAYSLATLDRIAARGGRYWLAEPPDLLDPALRAEVEERYRELGRCDGYVLYDLAPR